MASPKATAKARHRPELINEQMGPCPHCAVWLALGNRDEAGRLVRHCCRCEKEIGLYQNMNGAGFRAPEAHHYHGEMIATTHGGDPFSGWRPYFEELCLECYWDAWQVAYPNEPFPTPPMRIVAVTMPDRRPSIDPNHGQVNDE